MNTIIENGKIIGTMLGKEDHGIMTFYLSIELESGVCGFGRYSLDGYDVKDGKRVGSAVGMQAIVEILDCVGVTKWEDLTGAYIRCEHQGWGGKIIRIGNLIKDKWFSPEEFFAGISAKNL